MQCVPPPCVSVSVMLLSVVAEVAGIYKMSTASDELLANN